MQRDHGRGTNFQTEIYYILLRMTTLFLNVRLGNEMSSLARPRPILMCALTIVAIVVVEEMEMELHMRKTRYINVQTRGNGCSGELLANGLS